MVIKLFVIFMLNTIIILCILLTFFTNFMLIAVIDVNNLFIVFTTNILFNFLMCLLFYGVYGIYKLINNCKQLSLLLDQGKGTPRERRTDKTSSKFASRISFVISIIFNILPRYRTLILIQKGYFIMTLRAPKPTCHNMNTLQIENISLI